MIGARRLQQWNLARTGPYPWLVALIAIVLIFQLVRLFYTIVSPIGPVGEWRPPMALIIPFEERAGLLSAFDPYYRGDAPDEGAAEITSLDLTLYGVTFNRATGDGSAIISGADGVQNSIALGEEVAPGAVLAELGMDHVWIESAGQREILYLDQSIPAEEIVPGDESGATSTSEPGRASAAAVSPMMLAEGLTVQPRREGERVIGLSVDPQGDGQLFRQLGFRAGDVIVSANGQPVRSSADFTALARSGSALSLRVKRGSETVSVGIRLE